jgi:Tol biopolymer transport system component
LATLVAVCLISVACGGGKQSASQSSGAQVPIVPGALLVTGESTLDYVSKGHQVSIAKVPGVASYFEYPAFSPDGKMIAYVLATTPTGQGQDWGNDVYTANVDGSNPKLVVKHDQPGALIDSLSWTPDGQFLVYAYSRAQYDAQNHYTGSIYRIDRLSLSDGAVTTLITSAIQPSVSWDGKQIVYVDFPQNDFQAASLAVANIDGSNSQKVLTNQKGFQSFFAPHLSPDGKKVVFAAVGGPLGLPSSTPTPSLGGRDTPAVAVTSALSKLGQVAAPAVAEADGSPYQVWVANLDGSDLRTMSNLREDLPYPLWSSDGTWILFLGAGGLYSANADGTNLKRLGPGVPHGEIAWYQGG